MSLIMDLLEITTAASLIGLVVAILISIRLAAKLSRLEDTIRALERGARGASGALYCSVGSAVGAPPRVRPRQGGGRGACT